MPKNIGEDNNDQRPSLKTAHIASIIQPAAPPIAWASTSSVGAATITPAASPATSRPRTRWIGTKQEHSSRISSPRWLALDTRPKSQKKFYERHRLPLTTAAPQEIRTPSLPLPVQARVGAVGAVGPDQTRHAFFSQGIEDEADRHHGADDGGKLFDAGQAGAVGVDVDHGGYSLAEQMAGSAAR